MKRAAVGAFVMLMAVVLSGCPVPPPGYQGPVVDSVEVSPQPVSPGGTVTIQIEAHDDQRITNAGAPLLTTPNGTRLVPSCDAEVVQQGAPTHALITIECPVPTVALNGRWKLAVQINDSLPPVLYPGTRREIPFEVAGGSDDRTPPRLVEYSTSPAVVDQETPFTLTIRLRDDTLPVKVGNNPAGIFFFGKLGAPNSALRCANPTYDAVSSTDVDVTLSCYPENYNTAGRSEPGLHRSGAITYDALGNEGQAEMYIDVQPA